MAAEDYIVRDFKVTWKNFRFVYRKSDTYKWHWKGYVFCGDKMIIDFSTNDDPKNMSDARLLSEIFYQYYLMKERKTIRSVSVVKNELEDAIKAFALYTRSPNYENTWHTIDDKRVTPAEGVLHQNRHHFDDV